MTGPELIKTSELLTVKSLGNIFACCCACLLLAAGRGYAETVVWFDNFETNIPNRWSINNGVWHISSPSAGPATNAAGFRTHSGTNCASTQNFPAYLDSRLVCTNYNGTNVLVVPAASQFPRLRFWHWFNNQSALGFVEISTDKGINWNQISPVYQNTSGSGVWSRPSIDLSAYAGQSLQIAFRFYGSGSGSASGWYVDDVAVVTNSPAWNNPEGFEFGTDDWEVSAGTWEIGKPTSGPGAAHGGTNCAGTVLAGNYANNVDSRLISPPFIVPVSNSQALRFWHWYDFNNALGFVEISTDNGTNWNQISPTYQNSNTGGSWTNVSLDLSAYAGKKVKVAYHFGSLANSAPGWYVDDVRVVAAPVLTVPAPQTIYAGQSLNVTNYATLYPTNGTPLFTLVSPPATLTNLNLNPTNGVVTWVTTFTQPSGTNTITVKVADNNTPSFSATNSFTVVVVNPWTPVLTVPSTQTFFAGQTLNITNSATNIFSPGTTFTFATNSAPAGVLLNPASGVLTWVTTTAQTAGTNTIVITAIDNTPPNFSATNSFQVVVVNPPPPVLTVPPTPLAIYAGHKLTVTNSATNGVFPNAIYTFAVNSVLAGVSINPANGVLTGTPTSAQAPDVYSISVKVTDNNVRPLGATNSFLVIVSPPPSPALVVSPKQTIPVGNGFQFTLNTISNTTWRIDASTNLLTWVPIFTNLVGASGFLQFTDVLATNFPCRYYRAVFQ